MPNYVDQKVDVDLHAKTTGRISHPDNIERSIAHLRHRVELLRSTVDAFILIVQEGMSNKTNSKEEVEKLEVPPTRPLSTMLEKLPEDLRSEANAIDGIHEKIGLLKGMLL